MASSWIALRVTSGGKRYRVLFRVGGAESKHIYAGSFPTKTAALARKRWIDGELAAMRIPDLSLLEQAPARARTLADVAERWRVSRVDVATGTAATHRVNLGRILPRLGDRAVDSLEPADIAELVATLHADGLARESIRKTRATLAMVLDFARVSPNPARERSVKLPRADTVEVNPPAAPHVLAAFHWLSQQYRLPLLALDATGMRVGELEALLWGDLDEPAGQWRVRQAVAKTRYARFVPVHADVFGQVVELVPREDRDLDHQVFSGFGAARFRTALAKACKHAGVPAFSPNQLRHRRATLWHLAGVPIAQAALWLGHSAQEHLRTYQHATLADRREVDYLDLIPDVARLRGGTA